MTRRIPGRAATAGSAGLRLRSRRWHATRRPVGLHLRPPVPGRKHRERRCAACRSARRAPRWRRLSPSTSPPWPAPAGQIEPRGRPAAPTPRRVTVIATNPRAFSSISSIDLVPVGGACDDPFVPGAPLLTALARTGAVIGLREFDTSSSGAEQPAGAVGSAQSRSVRLRLRRGVHPIRSLASAAPLARAASFA